MELANGKKNKFFSIYEENENRYFDGISDEKNYVNFLCSYIEENSTIIDVGCGQGRFGKTLKDKNCILYGIEVDHSAAKCAVEKECYSDMFVMDIFEKNSIEAKRFKSNVRKVDYIIMADILEHLADPTEAIRIYYEMLKDNGSMLVSIPNISHIDIILNLIDGKFNYTDMGILDNTHLKFFTKDSFFDWIEQINEVYNGITLSCDYLGCTRYDNSYIEQIKREYIELYTLLSLREEYNSIQLFFKLNKNIGKSNREINKRGAVVRTLGDIIKKNIDESFKKEFTVTLEKIGQYDLDEHILKLNKEISGYQYYIAELEKGMKQKDEYITELEKGMRQKDGYITELEKGMRQKDEYITELEKGMRQKDEYITELEKGMRQKDEYITELEKGMKQKDKYIFELEKDMRRKNEYTSNIEMSLNSQNEYVENLVIDIEAQKEYIQLLENGSVISKGVIEKLESQIESLKENATLLNRKIFEMENSFSWKITRLLRRQNKV